MIEETLRLRHKKAWAFITRNVEEAVQAAKELELLTSGQHIECPTCNGRGSQGAEPNEWNCPSCGGRGHLSRERAVAQKLME